MKNFEKYKTVKERTIAFQHWCKNAPQQDCAHTECTKCQFAWLDLEAEEEKPLPCPFCGMEVHEVYNFDYTKKKLWCGCGYSSQFIDKDEEHSSHNRVARAVMEAKKDVSNG